MADNNCLDCGKSIGVGLYCNSCRWKALAAAELFVDAKEREKKDG